MRAVILDIPKDWLDERARLGHDQYDEMWGGVLHVVTPPTFQHQRLCMLMTAFLEPRLGAQGVGMVSGTGVYRPGAGGTDFRVPDLAFYSLDRQDLITSFGIEGTPWAVLEIREPNDEAYEKLEFWAKLGVDEVIIVEPERRSVEVLRRAGERYLSTSADDAGRLHARTLNVRFATTMASTPRLRVEHAGESVEI